MVEMEAVLGEMRALREELRGVMKFIEVKAMAADPVDQALSVKKGRAAEMLGVSRSTLDRMVACGELRTVKLRGREQVPMHELLRVTSLPAKREAPREKPPQAYSAKAEAARLRERLKSRR